MRDTVGVSYLKLKTGDKRNGTIFFFFFKYILRLFCARYVRDVPPKIFRVFFCRKYKLRLAGRSLSAQMSEAARRQSFRELGAIPSSEWFSQHFRGKTSYRTLVFPSEIFRKSLPTCEWEFWNSRLVRTAAFGWTRSDPYLCAVFLTLYEFAEKKKS